MRKWLRDLRKFLQGHGSRRSPRLQLLLEDLEQRSLLDAGFVQTNLVSDIPGLAAHFDPDLQNPWGFSETPQGLFRVAANGTGVSPLLTARGDVLGRAPVLAPPLGSPPGTTTTPNGDVANPTSDFVISRDGRSAPATTIFSTEDGTIVAFNPNVDRREGILVADQSATGAVYKLLALGSNDQGNFLYATNFHNNTIDVFDKNFHKVSLGANGFGTFTDPNAAPGFAPFGVRNINGTLFVTYAKQRAPENHDDEEGPGNGFIDEFDTSGNFLARFATGSSVGGTLSELNSPIGMAVAPDGFGPNGAFSGALPVGNFGDSHVNAFDINTGAFLGQLSDADGNPLTLNGGFGDSGSKGLWGIGFGNGHGGADPNTLFFAAGINEENDGLFGKVTLDQGSSPHHSRDRDDSPALATALGTTLTNSDGQTIFGRDLIAQDVHTGQALVAPPFAQLANGQTGTPVSGPGSLSFHPAHAAAQPAVDLAFSNLDLGVLG